MARRPGKRHHGKPSGANKSEGTGLRPDMPPEQLEQDLKMTDKYTEDGERIADNVHVRHPNRNTDKGDATTAGGYKQ